MMVDLPDNVIDEDFVFYSMLYSTITVLFAMAVLSRFLRNEFRFGFRSILSLAVLFIGEPLCHFFLKGSHGVVVFGLGCLLIYSILPASHLPVGDKTVFITGCDTGFGNAVVKKLDSIGMTVFAGCLYANGPGAIELQRTCSTRMKIIQLDVTDKEQVDKAFQYVTRQVGTKGLWGLINNAGIWYASELEMTSDKAFRHVMEVNLMGLVSVTNTFLPLLRKAKGRIVNMSSVTGKVPFECLGAYCVSKHGVEAYTDVLRLEMKKWGIKVSLIQPSGYNTAAMSIQNTHEKREYLWRTMDDQTKATYGREYYDQIWDNFESSFPKYPTDLTPVVRAMRSGLLSKRPRERFTVGPGVGTFLAFFPLLPSCLADHLCRVLGFAVQDIKPATLQ